MATMLEYANLANAVYSRETHLVGGWDCQLWEEGTWFGNGFQGGIYQGDGEVIVAFKGTALGSDTTVSDLTADARIGVGVIPNQAGGAYRMVVTGKEIAGSRPITIVGHSLGGALAQVAGVWCELPFVAFNSPGMKDHIKASAYNVFKPVQMARTLKSKSPDQISGWNMRINGDPVSRFGHHVGVEAVLPGAAVSNPLKAHSMDTCLDAVNASDYKTLEPFWF